MRSILLFRFHSFPLHWSRPTDIKNTWQGNFVVLRRRTYTTYVRETKYMCYIMINVYIYLSSEQPVTHRSRLSLLLLHGWMSCHLYVTKWLSHIWGGKINEVGRTRVDSAGCLRSLSLLVGRKDNWPMKWLDQEKNPLNLLLS